MILGVDVHTNRLKDQQAATDADELEMSAILAGPQVFEAGINDDRISGALEELDTLEGPEIGRLEALDLNADTVVGEVEKEIRRRQSIMGNSYPFKIEDSRITYLASPSGFYEFCLAASLAPNITTGAFVNIPRKFERIAAKLLQRFYGPNSCSLHVGAPRDHEVGTTFQAGMTTLSSQSGEFFWSPGPGLPANTTIGGDEGVDFVVWTRMPDKRPGSLFVLGQCACGDGWHSKWNDLNLPQLRKWFREMTYVEPVRAFAVPFQVVDGMLYHAMHEAGLIFDRARLTVIAEELSSESERQDLCAELSPITALVIEPNQTADAA